MVGKDEKKRIALFGGSFNPPHTGHTEICRWLAGPGSFDEVWVVPCFAHPLGKHLIPFDDRLRMCELAFAKLGLPIEILDIERELGGESRTLRTVVELMKRHPTYRFALAVGGDIGEQEEHWHRFDRIAELVDIVRIPRGGDSHIPDVSSTELRRLIGKGHQYNDMVEPEVADYISKNLLYKDSAGD
jgi:nicotinate-nucleotide adenylyltransferase